MTLKEAQGSIGQSVIYRPSYGREERGVITSLNELYVFVRYGDELTAKATYPWDLTKE